MTNKYIEQEVKYKVTNVNNLIDSLRKLGAVETGVDFQRTIRFDTSDNKLEKAGIFLRVRSGHGNVITMKKKIKSKNQNVHEREEIETSVEDLDKMRQIIVNLGFDKELIMEKYRSNWKYKNADLSIDELFFGCFLEIEANPKLIDEISNDLKLNKLERLNVTYWDIFNDYKKSNDFHEESIIFPKLYKPLLTSNANSFLGKNVEVVVDRQLGSKHPKWGFIYETNYGNIKNTISPDGEELDAYVLGIDTPIEKTTGKVIAVIHRTNDKDDKLIVSNISEDFDDETIRELTNFQEKFFESVIIRK